MKNEKRKLLQEVQSDRGWEVLEEYLEEYIERLNTDDSIKRDSQFETLWQRAYLEGGINHLRQFFKDAETEARKYI